ncbi:hypothetical protein [Desulfatiglans anilini]|uniref:hypothetical protein n=1 Tax=Desulfatiglans anilini TaxID=90728 RepID=UPI000414F0CD|nr:hypothetical protein [Desulfatiglans anilini]
MSRASVIFVVFLLSIGASMTGCSDGKEEPASKTRQTAPAAVLPHVMTTFAQELAVVGEAPKKAAAGAVVPLIVRVKNASEQVWPAKGVSPEDVGNRIRLGAYWVSAQGKQLPEEGYALLTEDLRPGESAELALEIKAPDARGVHVLHVSMLQEAVAWFSAKGAEGLDIPMMIE